MVQLDGVCVLLALSAAAAATPAAAFGGGASSTALPVAQRAEAWVRAKRKDKYFSAAPGISVLTVDPVSGARAFGDGVQRQGGSVAADADTLYEIGSLSKTMTTLGLSALAARGVLSFDDPVQKWLGAGFRLGPQDYVSATVTVRDLMAHRTGLGEGQGDSIGAFLQAPQFVRNLANVVPVRSLRDIFQ
jgi:CubicO group peptidase (beta-lactamase class C family)